MPAIATPGLADFLLLPSLKLYTFVSFVSFATLIFCVAHPSSHFYDEISDELESPMQKWQQLTAELSDDSDNGQNQPIHWLAAVICVNTAACILLLFALSVTRLVFGELRTQELNSAKDKFWNFVFYKFIFVFGVINVQKADQVALWAAWFSILSFLVVMTKISKLRFDHLSFSPNTPLYLHFKVLFLLGVVILVSFVISVLIIHFRHHLHMGTTPDKNFQTLTFLLAEIGVIMIKAIHIVLRYAIHLYDLNHTGLWEHKGRWLHYNDLVLGCSFLTLNLFHHLHMLLSGNLWLSMASLVICMHIRFLFNEIQKQYHRHLNYRRVVIDMECKYPTVNKKGECAICWDTFSTARQLPCGHCFHGSCLRLWLEQDATCPTCRRKLNHEEEVDQADGENEEQVQPQPVWQFNLRRISRWLPSLQVTVNYDHQPPPMNEQRLVSNANELLQVFPNISRAAIIEDLRRTGSMSLTTDNILDGQLDANQATDSDSEESQSQHSLHRRTVSDGQIRNRY